MSRPPLIPDELADSVFRGSDVVRRGILTRHQLHSKTWVRVLSDIYVRAGRDQDAAVRLEAVRLSVRPGTVICGRTAAWLHGCWDPPPGHAVPLEVTRPVRAPGTVVSGLSRRRLVLRGSPDLQRPPTGLSELDEDVVHLNDLPVTSATRTCFDLMRERYLVEAVVVADAFANRCGLSIPLLDAYCADRRRWPYVRRARMAVELASPAGRSPGESRLRMAVVLVGFGEPLVNVPVTDGAGTHIATPDLLLVRRRWLGIEYDGAYHDEGSQPEADRVRANRIATQTSLPLLRYDRWALLNRRTTIVAEVARLTGERPTADLDDRDFFRGRVTRAS